MATSRPMARMMAWPPLPPPRLLRRMLARQAFKEISSSM